MSGAAVVTEIGRAYLLGYDNDSFCVWVKNGTASDPGPLVASFERTSEAWTVAWSQFRALEDAYQPVEVSSSQIDVPRRNDVSVAPSLSPGSPWKASSAERAAGLITERGVPTGPNIPPASSSIYGGKSTSVIKQKIQPSAIVSAVFSLLAVADRALIYLHSKRPESIKLGTSALTSLKYISYGLAALGFVIGLSARGKIVKSDHRRSGKSIVWIGLMLGWIILLVALSIDLEPQLKQVFHSF